MVACAGADTASNDPTGAVPADPAAHPAAAGSATTPSSTSTTPAPAAAGTSADATTLISAAQQAIGTLNPATSSYQHATSVNEATGTWQVDCSGFLDYLLSTHLPAAFSALGPPKSGPRPLASDFYYFFGGLTTADPGPTGTPTWYRVGKPAQLRAGDVMVWLDPASASGDTGHVMLVLGPPTNGRAGELLVKVADSANSGHASDTRAAGQTGPGIGTVGLSIDGNGDAVGYFWRGGESALASTPSPVVFGRLE
jgi:hypothetical protein